MKPGQHPVFQCGFRPFFLLTAIGACVFLPVWLLIYLGQDGGLAASFEPSGGWLLWHAHELIYGFGMAAVSGFLLTSVPEFTGSPAVSRQYLYKLTLLWIAARVAYFLSGILPEAAGVLLVAGCNLVFFSAF